MVVEAFGSILRSADAAEDRRLFELGEAETLEAAIEAWIGGRDGSWSGNRIVVR